MPELLQPAPMRYDQIVNMIQAANTLTEIDICRSEMESAEQDYTEKEWSWYLMSLAKKLHGREWFIKSLIGCSLANQVA